ncbi:MAG: aspartate/glutamate racemase family protein [Pseudomonadota bacterium]
MKAKGGKPVYGASVGILMLDTQFPRILGDVGNARTWDFPVHYKVVRKVSPDIAVRQGAEGMLPHFIEAGQELLRMGADGITTSCGFLSLFQEELSKALKVPVVTSSLMQVAMVNATLPPGKRCGVLSISGGSLTDQHLAAANVPPNTPIGTTEGLRGFTTSILQDDVSLDVAAAREDNVQAALSLVSENPQIGALVLECTNMVPYASAIQQAVGLPVYSMVSLIEWFQSGLQPRDFLA